MISLNLPSFPIKTVSANNRTEVYDPLRRRFVRLTPEEWVRQHFVNFLISYRHYPAALMANEVTLHIGQAARRCDTVLYHPLGARPRLIVEYKAPQVKISQAAFCQICAYNSELRADYLIVSNGLTHFCCLHDHETNRIDYLSEIPYYEDLV